MPVLRIQFLVLFGSVLLILACQPESPSPACDTSLRVETILLSPSGCATEEGAVSVQVSGGIAPYQYQINAGPMGEEAQFRGLSEGSYVVSVTDSQGCLTETTIEVPSGISYADIAPVLRLNCMATDCHSSGGAAVDFSRADTVVAYAAAIEARTRSRNMPPKTADLTLSDAEIALIACWVGDGATIP